MRAFVAVVPDQDARAAAAELRDRVRAVAPAGARWVSDAALHVTLAFLGSIDAELLPRLRDALASAVGDLVPFDVTLGSPGAFPSAARPRVLWIGIASGGDPFCRLAGAVRAAMAPLPVEKEERPFRPHLTIARVRSPSRAPTLTADLRRVRLAETGWRVRNVTLFESVPGAGGPTYRALATVPLGGG